MMSSFVSQNYDAESGSHYVASSTSYPVSTLSTSAAHRRFSPARRLFCLLALFDFLTTLFIWILYGHGFSDNFKEVIKTDVKEYKFKKSVFDVVLLALWRMIVLLLVYALYVSRKWYAVGLTTGGSTVFLLVKAILMEFQPPKSKDRGSEYLYYVLVLSSLILSWVEVWVLDSKVIPAETKEEQRQFQEERRSLLHNENRRHLTPYSTISDNAFYTPEASDEESENEREGAENLALSQEDQEYIQKGKETMEITWERMRFNDGWKTEKVKDGVVVESKVIPLPAGGKKIYRLKGSLDAKAEEVFNLVVRHPEDAQKWGGNITDSFVVRQIDENTDIVYNSVGEAGGGVVSSRDFVNLRRWEKRGDVFVSCNVAVECDEMPPKKEHVRAANGPGGWAMQEAEGNPSRTEYVWLFDVDLKGWLPQSVIDAAMSFMLFQTGQGLKAYIQEQLG